MGLQPQIVPIIIRRKKAAHGGSHGGAWKVAYADFVTAMMALFIVLWLMGSSEKVKKGVAGYFNDPMGSAAHAGSAAAGSGENLQLRQEDLPKLKEKIEAALKILPEFQTLKDSLKITVTGEGLRIDLLENKDGMFFQSGSSVPTPAGTVLLAALAREVGKIKAKILIEGHTDSHPYSGKTGYSNWDLSGDRANAARRIMQSSGVGPQQVSQIRGFADQNLMVPTNPENPSNRRVSIVVQFSTPADHLAEEAKPSPVAGAHGEAPKAAAHAAPKH